MSVGPVVNLSELRSSVTIRKLQTQTEEGTVNHSYSQLACGVKAKLEGRPALPLNQADRVHERMTHMVTILYREGVTGADQIVLSDGRVLEILGIPRRVPEDRPQVLQFECSELQ